MPITTTPSGGPQGEFSTYTPIYSQTLSATATSVTFSNIPTTYTDLELVFSGTCGSGQAFLLQANGDNTYNYSETWISANGTSATSGRDSNASFYQIGNVWTTQTQTIVKFMNYSNTKTYKTILGRNDNAAQVASAWVSMWRSTSPITSIKVFPNSGNSFQVGSTFTIYGIKAAATQFIPSKAIGGDYAYSDGTYAYHVFNSTGSLIPTTSLTASLLVIGGGGAGGGFDIGGGGGAGGVVYTASQALASGTTYTCTVGAGGYGSKANGTSGSNSNITGGSLSLTAALGGGYGSGNSNQTVNGGSGASGGGGGEMNYTDGTGGTGTQGYNGAAATNATGGGGGGAGGAASGSTGGVGISTYSSWATATNTGSSGYYAGGGGGGRYGGIGGAGGAGGGGNGGSNLTTVTGAFGSPNTGSGGGGAGGGQSALDIGGNGGSGVIIVRYAL